MTPEIMEQVTELRENGWSYQRISKKVGVSPGSISWYCLREGIESPRNEAKVLPQTRPGPMVVKRGNHVVRAFTPDEDDQLLAMEAEGLSRSEIARRLDRKPNSIRGRLMVLGRHEARAEACS